MDIGQILEVRGRSRFKEFCQMHQRQYDLKLVVASNTRYHYKVKDVGEIKR